MNIIFASLLLLVLFGDSLAKFSDIYPITCTSVVKLLNVDKNVRLHSHEVNYGSGSGQQSITGNSNEDDVNSHWQILPANNKNCDRKEPVKCGAIIRLMHVQTRCFLHSHLFSAPLSSDLQEISCFGGIGGKEKKNKEQKVKVESDSGDHFEVLCNADIWMNEDEVYLKHVDTKKYLSATNQKFGRPIAGQNEIAASSSKSNDALWKTVEGIYFNVQSD